MAYYGIFARAQGANAGYIGAVQTANGPSAYIATMSDLTLLERLDSESFPVDTEWHTYRLEVQGNQLRFFIDGGLYLETTDNTFLDSGQAGLASFGTEMNVRSFRLEALP